MAGILDCAKKRYAQFSEVDGSNLNDDGFPVRLDYRRLVWCRAKPKQIVSRPVVHLMLADPAKPARPLPFFHLPSLLLARACTFRLRTHR
jgi:hypothetical protein